MPDDTTLPERRAKPYGERPVGLSSLPVGPVVHPTLVTDSNSNICDGGDAGGDAEAPGRNSKNHTAEGGELDLILCLLREEKSTTVRQTQMLGVTREHAIIATRSGGRKRQGNALRWGELVLCWDELGLWFSSVET